MPSPDEQVTLPASAVIEASATLYAIVDRIHRFNEGQDADVTMQLENAAGDLLEAAGTRNGAAGSRHPLEVEARARCHELNGEDEIAERIRMFGDAHAEFDEWVDEQINGLLRRANGD